MAGKTNVTTARDDERHLPGPDSLPLWSESFWFPFYDPKSEIGVVFRIGSYPNREESNVFLFLTHRGYIVHSLIDQRVPLPKFESRRLAIGSLLVDWEAPLERFRLRYTHWAHGFDVVWEGISPVYQYPAPPETTIEQVPRHLEHAGIVRGTVTLAGKAHPIDCFAHRDHSFGGERDWAKFYRWNYLSGEIDRDFWFNAVRIKFGPDVDDITIGCLWNGHELRSLPEIRMDVRTADEGTRQLGVDLHVTDEAGEKHHIVGEEVLVNCPVLYGRTWLKDGITRYRYGARVGYGILEHGYQEK
jgi:hypothetical protein